MFAEMKELFPMFSDSEDEALRQQKIVNELKKKERKDEQIERKHYDTDETRNGIGYSGDTYICDYCGTKIEWDAADYKKGNIWVCEECGVHFCSDCFCEETNTNDGVGVYDDTLCPDCFLKQEKEGIE